MKHDGQRVTCAVVALALSRHLKPVNLLIYGPGEGGAAVLIVARLTTKPYRPTATARLHTPKTSSPPTCQSVRLTMFCYFFVTRLPLSSPPYPISITFGLWFYFGRFTNYSPKYLTLMKTYGTGIP